MWLICQKFVVCNFSTSRLGIVYPLWRELGGRIKHRLDQWCRSNSSASHSNLESRETKTSQSLTCSDVGEWIMTLSTGHLYLTFHFFRTHVGCHCDMFNVLRNASVEDRFIVFTFSEYVFSIQVVTIIDVQ